MENYINTKNMYLSSNNAGIVNNDLFCYFTLIKLLSSCFCFQIFSLCRNDNTATQSSYYGLLLII